MSLWTISTTKENTGEKGGNEAKGGRGKGDKGKGDKAKNGQETGKDGADEGEEAKRGT